VKRILAGLVLAGAVGAEAGVEVMITRPAAGEVVFGEVSIAAEVTSGERIAKVTFMVDGRTLRELAHPPWEVMANMGQDNVQHHLRVVARTVSGSAGEATLVTPRIVVDEEVTFELQQLYVSVTDDGQRVLDLDKGDFKVFDDGDGQEILNFARGDAALTAVVLVDASLSMQGPRLAAALAGARTFFSGMRTLDEGKLLVYNDHTELSTPFTNVPEVLLAGLGAVKAGGGTTLNDHLYLALKLLEQRQGRRAVVVLSDGLDANSVLSASDVLLKARQSQALVYWIRLREGARGGDTELPPLFSAWRNAAWYREQLRTLDEMVVESGGRVTVVRELGELAPAFAEVMRELREQYVLGYYPTGQKDDGRWHRVKVKVERSGVQVRTREGYLDI
jgi:Ca-activated chloride channel family protein